MVYYQLNNGIREPFWAWIAATAGGLVPLQDSITIRAVADMRYGTHGGVGVTDKGGDGGRGKHQWRSLTRR